VSILRTLEEMSEYALLILVAWIPRDLAIIPELTATAPPLSGPEIPLEVGSTVTRIVTFNSFFLRCGQKIMRLRVDN
jgi:hypothetical protein